VHVQNGYISTSSVPRHRFPVGCGNFGNSRTFNAVIGLLLISACILRTSSPKIGGFERKWGMGGAMFTPNKLIFIFGGFNVCANFAENPSRNASMSVHTERHMDRGKLVL